MRSFKKEISTNQPPKNTIRQVLAQEEVIKMQAKLNQKIGNHKLFSAK